MIEEELPDELENDLDDIEPVGDESQLYEHFRGVVDKGQAMVRVDKYLFERCHYRHDGPPPLRERDYSRKYSP